MEIPARDDMLRANKGETMMNLGRGLVVLGGAILLLLAALHALSYGTDSGEIAKSNLPPISLRDFAACIWPLARNW
jgi:hypothetical protein